MYSSSTSLNGHRYKVTVVGDGMVGKTCFLIKYKSGVFFDAYIPTVFDNYICTIDDEDHEQYPITVWDTAGEEDYDKLRPLIYPLTSCIVLCYAIDDRNTYANISSKWLPEVRQHMPETPIVLVATKSDLRVQKSTKFVTTRDGNRLMRRIGAYSVVECSALRSSNLDEIFKQVIRAIKRKPKPHQCRFGCVML